jgi:hypothetical protein
MKILVYEDNLLWSSRLAKSIKAFGHEVILRSTPESVAAGAQVAIVNLGTESLKPAELVPALNAQGVYTIGHAGHKETELMQFGQEVGCSRLVTNSQLTFKLDSILSQVNLPDIM